MTDYHIADEEKTLGFMLSILRDAKGSPVKTDGGYFVPTEDIKKK